MTTSLLPNLHADMRGVKDYTLGEGNYRWEHNTNGGFTLQRELVAYIDVGAGIPERKHVTWQSLANVYKTKRGNRYIAEVRGYRELFPFLTLREAMRMAKFLIQNKSNS